MFTSVCVVNLLFLCLVFFFFKQKTAYELRISDWSSDVCSSDLATNFMHARIEWRIAALGGIHAQRTGEHRISKQDFRQEQPIERQGGRHLRAVDQGKALFGGKHERGNTRLAQGITGPDKTAINIYPPPPEHSQRPNQQQP